MNKYLVCIALAVTALQFWSMGRQHEREIGLRVVRDTSEHRAFVRSLDRIVRYEDFDRPDMSRDRQ